MIKLNHLRNNKGFTAVEVTVGVGLVALLTVVMVSTQLMVSKDQVELAKQLDDSIDETLAERILFNDLSEVDPSYNNVTLKDDAGRNFFDFYPDVPGNLIPTSLKRSFILKPDIAGKKFSVLSQDTTLGSVMNYDPPAAYDIGPAPTDFNKAATLDFKGLNRKSFVTAVRPEFWINGQTLMLDTPAKLRPVIGGVVDMKIPPRSPTFIGVVNGSDLISLKSDSSLADLFFYTQPDTGALIDTADTFLRNAPSVGGGQTMVRLRAVKVMQYYLEVAPNTQDDCKSDGAESWYKPARLMKVTYRKGAFTAPVMLADKVCSFELTRDSVMKRMIYFKVNKVDQKLLKIKKSVI